MSVFLPLRWLSAGRQDAPEIQKILTQSPIVSWVMINSRVGETDEKTELFSVPVCCVELHFCDPPPPFPLSRPALSLMRDWVFYFTVLKYCYGWLYLVKQRGLGVLRVFFAEGAGSKGIASVR